MTLDESATSTDLLSEYALKDYKQRDNLITAYVSVGELEELCKEPAVIYVRLPVKFNSR